MGYLFLRRILAWVLFCCCLCAGSSLKAQSSSERYELLNTRNGLINNEVLSVFQDSKGYMWFGTQQGLCKYDGNRFKFFNDHDTGRASLIKNAVNKIFESRDGLIWVGTRTNGLFAYDRQKGTWRSFYKHIGKVSVYDIYEDKDSNLWIGTGVTERKLFRLRRQPDGGFSCRSVASLNSTVSHIFTDANGILNFATETNIYRIDPKGTITVVGEEEPHDWIKTVSDRQGNFYLLAENKFSYYHVRTQHWIHINDHYFNNRIASVMHVNKKGELLLADKNYLRCYNNKGELLYLYHVGRLANVYELELVNALYEDASGVIWIGTHKGLVKLIRPAYPFSHFTSHPQQPPMFSLSGNYVRSLFTDKEQNLWVGYKQGYIDCIRGAGVSGRMHLETFHPVSSTGTITVNTFLQTKDGTLLCGGLEGLYCVKGRQVIPYPTPLRVPTQIWSLLEDSKGNIWAGTNQKGLYMINPGTGKVQNYLNGATDDISVWCMSKDHSGQLLLGTNKGILKAEFSPGGGLHFTPMLKAADGTMVRGREVWCIHPEPDGTLMIGTTDGGLSIVSPGWKHVGSYNETNGLPGREVTHILPAPRGRYWLMTVNGLSLFDPVQKSFMNFNEDDGLLSGDLNFKAAAVAGGQYFVGTKVGLVTFDPAKITAKLPSWRNVYITAFRTFDKLIQEELRPGSEISLSHKDNSFSFELAILDYENRARHRFRYRLEGFDRDWRYTDYTTPVAYYTNVPHGRYTFVVQGITDGQLWSGPGTSLHLTVHPAFWETIWFRVLAVLMVTGVSGTLIFWRFRTALKREKESNRISRQIAGLELRALQAQMNPHFIFNAVNAVQHFMLNRDERAAHDYLSKFAGLMRLYLESSKKKYIILEEELSLLTLYVSLEQMRFGDRFEFRLIVDEAINPKTLEIPSMLIQPFVENAVNHGLSMKKENGLLTISFKLTEDNALLCTVDDNGIGRRESARIKDQSLHTHISRGMELVYERLSAFEELEGARVKIQVTDKEDATKQSMGTSVSIKIPLE